MKTLSILCLPALALATTFSGTVVDLSGAPIAGAVVKTLADSATTPGNGSWTLARTLSVARRNAKPISVASHLAVENGRPRLVFGGVDASGHRSATVQAASPALAAGRTASAVGTDTLKLYWKGKRLVVLPIAALDSTGIVLRVDTAWGDDAGTPWNPAISYGSVLDVHDGKTYRTVAIGSQWWMAENLNYKTDSSRCYSNDASNCWKYGRLYQWSAAMGLAASYNTTTWGGSDVKHQGICPSGWHVPSDAEWTKLTDTTMATATAGTKLKSIMSAGTDTYGFRVLPAGCRYDDGSFDYLGSDAYFWSASEGDASLAWSRYFSNGNKNVYRYDYIKSSAFSLRCLKDAP